MKRLKKKVVDVSQRQQPNRWEGRDEKICKSGETTARRPRKIDPTLETEVAENTRRERSDAGRRETSSFTACLNPVQDNGHGCRGCDFPPPRFVWDFVPQFFTAFPSITENILSTLDLRLHTAIFNS